QFDTGISNDVFSFVVKRKSTGRRLFDTSIGGLIFSDQFLQIATYLPSDAMYGWGENVHPTLKHNFSTYHTWAMLARDEPPNSAFLDTKNLYGVHPFYMILEPDGKAHGVLLLNSNAQEVTTAPGPVLIYRTIGGNLDMYFFPGPTPEEVTQQYLALIGTPFLPAYWALGYQISRYGYKDLNEMTEIIGRNMEAGIPLDTAVADIDYMDRYKDFTTGQNWTGLSDYVKKLHSWGMRTILIFDPAIQVDYESFQRGVDAKARFIEWERADQVMRSIQVHN
ncbi:glycosyl hydrolase, family 31, partial [Cooperia oncophora]